MRVAIIGLGYVGLPLSVEFVRGGLSVIGIDVSEEKVNLLRQGRSYVLDVPDTVISEIVNSGSFLPTTQMSALAEADAVCICVPTPLTKTKDPDISYILEAVAGVEKYLHPGMTIVLESTTYPGTTEELVLPRLESTGLKVGKDFFLAFSPERVDPGNKQYTIRNTPKVIGGVTPTCTEKAVELYRHAVDCLVPVSSPRTAEMTKLLENTYRAINIGLVNELAIMCHHLCLDVWEVIEAAKTKPFGFVAFYPSPGLGGHCIPIDPQYLSWKLRTFNYTARFIDLATAINSAMPEFVVNRIADALNDECKSVRGSSILILGVAYKKNISDTRESPALDIIGMLRRKGAHVQYADPYVPSLEGFDEKLRAYDLSQGVAKFDCVAIITDHDAFDYNAIVREARLVFDGRNATARCTVPSSCRIVKL
ncbi:MAG TPA: nucleotide sugar dehydrogenase [Candidatus Hydrogenedentes bacterium]|nr:nucleotide sugar dehydrogenase [Candidatus Hydrogenedentota bacterium]HOL78356.1 nucleotide sugar dehydrogenase [Candidatus Hydrogenedentota bacterium]HPO87572.1 nucleotide sugar dehydrogenase [Candidatus Hydrogenedentota bacterium]